MQLLVSLTRLLSRFRYPFSLPEEVAHDLGMHLPNTLTFPEFLKMLNDPYQKPRNLRKYMQRRDAEDMFVSAIKREIFQSRSLFSYYFNKGWLVFTLYYDETDKLRRIYLQCPASSPVDGFDLPLDSETVYSH